MKERRKKYNYLLFGSNKIDKRVIDFNDFSLIIDVKAINAKDYCRIFTYDKDTNNFYAKYIPGNNIYYLLKEDLFKKYLKEINDEAMSRV